MTRRTPPAAPKSTHRAARQAHWIARLCAGLALLLALSLTACESEKNEETESSASEESAANGEPEAEVETTTGEASDESADDTTAPFPDGSAEAGFLAVLADLTPILASDGADTDVAGRFEAHYAANKASITAAAKALQAKKMDLDPDAQVDLEDSLSATETATAFVDAMEGFQSRASGDVYKRVEDIMLEVYNAAEDVTTPTP